jgi:hypothetical protein
MKNFNMLLIVCLALMTVSLCAQTNPGVSQETVTEIKAGPIMTFESNIVEYGEIEQHSEPLRIAKFTNTGVEPLIIQSARGSCGCTVPTYPKQPIMPGESAEIEIRYDTKRLGKINKTVTITTNEGGEPHVLKVQGTINAIQEDGVPTAPNGLVKPN